MAVIDKYFALPISVEFLASCPLLGGGVASASTSFINTFSNATTAILENISSTFSPAKTQKD